MKKLTEEQRVQRVIEKKQYWKAWYEEKKKDEEWMAKRRTITRDLNANVRARYREERESLKTYDADREEYMKWKATCTVLVK